MAVNADFVLLGSDLSGNAEIAVLLQKGEACLKNREWEDALCIFEKLSEEHPYSRCGYFGKARAMSEDFTRVDILNKSSTAEILNEIIVNIKNCKSLCEEFSEKYDLLTFDYMSGITTCFSETYINKVEYVIESFEEVGRVCTESVPEGCSLERYIFASIGELFDELISNPEDTFYELDEDLIEEMSVTVPSLRLAAMHKNVIELFMKHYYSAVQKQNQAEKVNDVWYYDNFVMSSTDTLSMVLRTQMTPIHKYAPYDPSFKRVMSLLLRLAEILDMPVGSLNEIGLPEVYYNEVKSDFEAAARRPRRSAEAQASRQMLMEQSASYKENYRKDNRKKIFFWSVVAIIIIVVYYGTEYFF